MLDHTRTKGLQSWAIGDFLGQRGEITQMASQRTKPLGSFQAKLTPRLYDHLIAER